MFLAKSSHRFPLILILIGFLLYFPSLFGPFLWDDEDFVYANKYVQEFRLDKFFSDSQTAGRGKLSNYYRPLPQVVYATTHAVFGYNPFWFHLVNVFFHICAACAIYYFFLLLFKNGGGTEEVPLSAKQAVSAAVRKQTNLTKSNNYANSRLSILRIAEVSGPPFLITLFFLIHPVQTEAVSYISGLSDPLFVLFGFLCLIFLLLKDERKNMLPLSLFFFILSLLSKETGLVFLGLITVYYSLFTYPITKIQPLITWLKLLITTLFPYIITTLIYLWYHFTFINKFNLAAAWGNTLYANSLTVRLLTFIQNLFSYVALLIFPKDLFMERDFGINIQTQILNPYLIGFIVINLLVIFLIRKLRNCLEIRRLNLVIFLYLAFFTSFLPYSGIVLINGIFYEHFLYLPLVFFFAFIFLFVSPLLKNKIFIVFLLSYILFLICRNIFRQSDWSDAIRFYSQTLKHAPNSVRIRNGLAMAYAEKGDLDKSIREYQLAIRDNPRVPNLYHNLANTYAAKGDLNKAEENYLKAIDVDPKFIFSYQSLINLYQQTNQQEKLHQLTQTIKSASR